VPSSTPAGSGSSPASATRVAIALGSNLGDRARTIGEAAARLRALLDDVVLSSCYDTAPVGVGDQPRFLNAAAIGSTSLPARALLDALLEIERGFGRERPFAGAPRTLDLDLILYGRAVIAEPGLHVPHARFRERAFVLDPLAEIAPDWIDPVTGQSIAALRDRLSR
jgi:2-amino-4-hydroxy-6-hydroxymethyldihydropteridine diphosphokinase